LIHFYKRFFALYTIRPKHAHLNEVNYLVEEERRNNLWIHNDSWSALDDICLSCDLR